MALKLHAICKRNGSALRAFRGLDSLSLVTGHFPDEPSKPVRPIDEVQVAHSDQCPFEDGIVDTLAASHADQAVVRTLLAFDDSMRLSKDGKQRRLNRCAIRKVTI